jgi:hypothetical protein
MVGGTNWEGGAKQWLRSIYEYDPAQRAWRKDRDLPEPIANGADFDTPAGFGFLGGSDGTKPSKPSPSWKVRNPGGNPSPTSPLRSSSPRAEPSGVST